MTHPPFSPDDDERPDPDRTPEHPAVEGLDLERIVRLIPYVERDLEHSGQFAWADGDSAEAAAERDTGRADLLTDLMLHLARITDHDVDTSPATLRAEGLAVAVLARLDVATDDAVGVHHVAAAVAMSAHDRDHVVLTAYRNWAAEKDGDDITATEELTADLFRLAR